jgi:hypothetical protein
MKANFIEHSSLPHKMTAGFNKPGPRTAHPITPTSAYPTVPIFIYSKRPTQTCSPPPVKYVKTVLNL